MWHGLQIQEYTRRAINRQGTGIYVIQAFPVCGSARLLQTLVAIIILVFLKCYEIRTMYALIS